MTDEMKYMIRLRELMNHASSQHKKQDAEALSWAVMQLERVFNISQQEGNY